MSETDLHIKFVEQAQPHNWMLVADNLHDQAKALRKLRGTSLLTRISETSSTTWDNTDRAVFLLCGFALENAIKAFLVYENPSWISNGRLSGKLKSHKIAELAKESHLIPYPKRSLWVLARFEEGLESWARYPTSLKVHTTTDLDHLDDQLWNWYLRLTSAYGRKMNILLKKTWHGPHGWDGYFKFEGEPFFG